MLEFGTLEQLRSVTTRTLSWTVVMVGVVRCVCDVSLYYLNTAQYNSLLHYICEHLLVRCVVSCGMLRPLS